MRVVLDANVLISAAISHGPSHRIVHAWLTDEPFELVICYRLIEEVRSVLTERPRLRKWIRLEAERHCQVRHLLDDLGNDLRDPSIAALQKASQLLNAEGFDVGCDGGDPRPIRRRAFAFIAGPP